MNKEEKTITIKSLERTVEDKKDSKKKYDIKIEQQDTKIKEWKKGSKVSINIQIRDHKEGKNDGDYTKKKHKKLNLKKIL